MINYDHLDIQLPILFDAGIKNIVVSGCSFTRNPKDDHALSWPLFLKASIGADKVYDCSLPGAGNYHIAHSLIWGLETHDIDPRDSLIVAMWSGNDRDDAIVDHRYLNRYPYQFYYSPEVVTAISGGEDDRSHGNVILELSVKKLKSPKSRAIENYLYITTAWHYLQSRGYKTIFTEFTDRHTPNLTKDFDIRDHLSDDRCKKLNSMMAQNLQDIYTWSLKRGEMEEDDLHPGYRGHLSWVQQILVPWIKNNWHQLDPV